MRVRIGVEIVVRTPLTASKTVRSSGKNAVTVSVRGLIAALRTVRTNAMIGATAPVTAWKIEANGLTSALTE
jgi:hypothetical protein